MNNERVVNRNMILSDLVKSSCVVCFKILAIESLDIIDNHCRLLK